jgi:NADH-quinone oxidoreductase subunit G
MNHNRCIVCYRCVRFEEEIVGESNLGLFERGYHSIIGLAKSEPINHNFQGALADICPVGALQNKETLFKSRVWWYKTYDMICHGCSTGCNVNANVRDNKMYRYMVRENPDLGMYFICDTGRFDLDWMNENRLLSYYNNGISSTSTLVIPEIADLWNQAKSIGILGGGSETNENLESIQKTLKPFSASKEIRWESRVTDAQYKETEQVDFLLTKDRHPNTRGCVDLGIITKDRVSGIVKDFNQSNLDLLFIIKEELPAGIDPSRLNRVVLIETNLVDAVKSVGYSIPTQIFAEQSGSFTNKNGLKQTFPKAIEPVQGLLNTSMIFDRLTSESSVMKEGRVVGQ